MRPTNQKMIAIAKYFVILRDPKEGGMPYHRRLMGKNQDWSESGERWGCEQETFVWLSKAGSPSLGLAS